MLALEPTTAVPAATPRKHETDAEALYRHGLNCMDNLERDACAIKYFEQLVAENPPERQLVGDAMLRLVKLYERSGRQDDGKLLLRQFWDVGMKRRRHAAIPWSAKFMPPDISVMVLVDVTRTQPARVFSELPVDAKDRMFTCNETRRQQLRAKRVKSDQDERGDIVVSTGPPKHLRQPRTRPGPRPRQSSANKLPEPVWSKGLCQVLHALGHDDLRVLAKFVMGMNHSDPVRSSAVLVLEGADQQLAKAEQTGTLVPVQSGVWALRDVRYHGKPVHVARLDRDEITLAGADVMPGILAAKQAHKLRIDDELWQLMGKVPNDVAFFTVVTRAAMRDQMAEFGPMAKLLPQPDGLLVSAVAYDYAGVFVRMPTRDPLRATVLVALVRRLLEDNPRRPKDSPVSERNMDISKSPDGEALILSAVLSRPQVRQILTD